MTEQIFLKDVKNHSMKVLMDNGLYRHLRFANADPKLAWNQWFEIITWPGALAYSGDMGTFVFRRLEDMFEFFRTRPSNESPKRLHINLSYWAEKVEAVDRDGYTPGTKKYSPELFREVVLKHFNDWAKDERLPRTAVKAFREELEDSVLQYADDSEHEARKALSGFQHEIESHKLEFYDTWEWDFSEWTGRYIWCCYALAWAIRFYDKSKDNVHI